MNSSSFGARAYQSVNAAATSLSCGSDSQFAGSTSHYKPVRLFASPAEACLNALQFTSPTSACRAGAPALHPARQVFTKLL
jgi:hypothetical protein